MKLGLYPNWKAKQRVFAYFFKGLDLEAFNDLCQRFAADSRHLLRPKAIEALQQARAEGADVVIVSASIDNWVQPFFTAPGALDLPALTVLGAEATASSLPLPTSLTLSPSAPKISHKGQAPKLSFSQRIAQKSLKPHGLRDISESCGTSSRPRRSR